MNNVGHSPVFSTEAAGGGGVGSAGTEAVLGGLVLDFLDFLEP